MHQMPITSTGATNPSANPARAGIGARSANKSDERFTCRLLSREDYFDVGAPIELPTPFGTIGRNRICRTMPFRLEAAARNRRKVLRNVLDYGERAAFGQCQVGGGATGRIGIPFDAQIGVAKGGHG